VWSPLINPETMPLYLPGVFAVSTDAPSEILRKGTTLRGGCHFMGVEAQWTGLVVTYVEPQRMGVRLTISTPAGRPVDANVESTLEPVAEGTLLSLAFRANSGFSGVFGTVADDVVSVAYARILQAQLSNFADWLDEGKRRNLTPRHREVLRMIQQGLTDREIAEKLYISPKTVGHHVSAILSVFRVTHRQDLRRSTELPDQ
jgi:DNA-binding CsgD family transcriptional regulator